VKGLRAKGVGRRGGREAVPTPTPTLRYARAVSLVVCTAAGFACAPKPDIRAPLARAAVNAPPIVDDRVLADTERYAADWLTYAGSYRGQRFSPLAEVDRRNVASLVPKWAFSLGTVGAQQCTPIVHRGVMYVTSTGGRINAVNAETGELIWEFDSRPPADAGNWGPDTNRGPAIYKDHVIWCNVAGTIFAHDRRTGEVRWSVTPDNYKLGFVKSLAPLIVKGKVIVGTSGGQYGVRGFVEALDAETGQRAWKTYTIPGPGEPGHETWPQDNDSWEHGGGCTWVTGSYDPELNLIYWGTGNAGPWNADKRPGDNLYTCSLLALDADTGKIRWHYQVVPNDTWDYDASVTPVLTEIEHDGKTVPVIVVAVKDGFFYVLDRRDGNFLKARQFADRVTWCKGLDRATGRPIPNPDARPNGTKRVFVSPSAVGATNWWGTAHHPGRKWLYIVANETGMEHVFKPVDYVPGQLFTGYYVEELPKVMYRTSKTPGRLIAFDLQTMDKRWEAEREPQVRWGGMLVTAGELLFAGTMRGYLQAMDAETGKRLWQFQTGSGVMAHPVTYAVGGKQYVAVVSGRGGVANPGSISPSFFEGLKNQHASGMVFAFALP
jgi:alcohol dehydrogenase (cytochrome c)